MKALGNVMIFILVTGFIVALVAGGFFGIRFIFSQYGFLQPEATAYMIIFTALALLCTFILAAAIRYRQNRKEAQVNPEKAFIYGDFINYYIFLREGIRTEGLIKCRFRSDMVLWAGSRVLKKYMVFNQYLDELSPDNPKILEQAEKVIMEMRNELGQYTYGLKTGDLDKLIAVGRAYEVNNHHNHKARVT